MLLIIYVLLLSEQDVKCETSRTFRNSEREYLKHRVNEPETGSKNKNVGLV
jgi:hypothetical protein